MKMITRWGLAFDISVSLIVLLALVSPAGAEVEVYSTDFEQTEGYTLGDLDGQLGWEADEDPGDCVVQSSDRSSGSWAVKVTADGDYDGGFHEGAGHAFTYPSETCNKLTVALDTKITASNEADYLVTLLREASSEIVCYVRFLWGGGISVNGTTTGSTWTANAWVTLKIELDFERGVADVFYDGKQVANDVAFAGTDPVDAIGIVTDDYVGSGSSMLFDNLRITARGNPFISAITPTSGPKLTYMKIEGQDFGSSAGSVQFNGGTGTVSSWSDTTIYCRAPEGVATGGVFISTPGMAETLFSDSFDSTTIDGAKWTSVAGATVDSVGVNEPSSPYSLRLNGNPSGGDSIASKVIDLSPHTGATLSYYYQRTGGGNSTESGEDLFVEYWNGSSWVELERQLGSGADMTSYALSTVPLPAQALHTGFRFRFRSIGTTGAYDDWFVDDVTLGTAFDSNPVTFTVTVPSIIHVSNTTNVPGIENGTTTYPFSTVQRGIDAASDGAEVVVAQGTYVENVNFNDKAITVRSTDPDDPAVVAATILDGNQAGTVVTFNHGEGLDSVLKGFTVQNGHASSGGGIYCSSSSPTIQDNTITGNSARYGGGIYCRSGSSPTIQDNTITGNSARYGGGIYCYSSLPTIQNNTISGNSADYSGGGIYCSSSSPTIENNVISGNSASDGGGIYCSWYSSPAIQNNTIGGNSAASGGGIYCDSSSPTITNCILWDNGDDLYGCSATYSCIEDDDAGEGNFSLDPMFADPAGDDYHLKSQVGHWDPAAGGGAGGWALDAVTSPCIDAGDPVSDYGNEPSPNGGRVNMGAYGDTAYASKSVPPPVLASVLPDSGPPYTLMKVTGSWFSHLPGTVEVAGVPLNILSWSDTEIRCEVPPEATSGPLVVKRLNGVESNPVAFAVTDPTIIYVDDDNTSGIENGTLTWPFSTVQRAIRAATNGDTVQVAEGTYVENINFLGKAITVRSATPDDPAVVAATILDGNHSGSVVTFNHGEGPDSVLKGFTIRNGIGTDYCGAGVHCHGASPTVEKNVITGNTALAHGGGIYSSGGAPTIRDNRVEGNEARWFGGGIACWNSTAVVTGNLVRDNAAHWYGGGLLVHGPAAPTVRNNVFSGNTGSEGAGIACLYQCAPLFENNTLAGNIAERAGGGLYAGWDCSPLVRNSILWANEAPDGPELALDVNSTATVSYSDTQGGQPLVHVGTGCSVTWGTGNLDLDPLLDTSGYCHLKSTGGRYDRTSGLPPESAGAWVLDSVTSPCIDSGDPASVYTNELAPNGSRINMGAWGNTAYASKSAGVGGLAVGGAKAQADGAEADGPVGADDGLGDERQENERDGGGEERQRDGTARTTDLTPAPVGVSPRLVKTNPALGANLAGQKTLTLTFDRAVTVGASGIEVYGASTAAHNDYALTYRNSRRTVRLEWATPLPADDYEVRLVAEFISDKESRLPLDGEVADPADPESLPSGDGRAGGDAHLEFEAE